MQLVKTTLINYLNLATGEFTGDVMVSFASSNPYTWEIREHSHPFTFFPDVFGDTTGYMPILEQMPTENGVYTYAFEITNRNHAPAHEVVYIPFYIELHVTGADVPEPEPPTECRTKYFMEWTGNDLEHDKFKVELCYNGFEGEPTRLNGYCDLEYKEVKDVLECLRGASANLTIHATPDLDINDIFFENERDVKLTLYQNDEILFLGYVKPDGIWASFVEEHYNIDIDAIDNLGTLKNLAFTEDGKIVTGRMTQMEALQIALRRTGFDFPINVLIKKHHNSQPDGTNPLIWTRISTEQYFKDDGSTAMDCEKIIKSILEPYCAIVHQWRGEWFVYSPLDLDDISDFFHYDEFGKETIKSIGMTRQIGSAVNHFDWHHINKNQQFKIRNSLGAFRAHYKYGKVHTVLKNGQFVSSDGEMEGWELLNGAAVGAYGQGVRTDEWNTLFLQSNSEQNINITQGTSLSISLDFLVRRGHWGVRMLIKIGDYYLNGDQWGTIPSGTVFEHYEGISGAGRTTISLETAPIIQSGTLEISFYTLTPLTPLLIDGLTILYGLKITAGNESENIGEFHTIERIDNKSTEVMDVKQVHHGDGTGDFYLGTLHDVNDNQTVFWRRHNNSINFELLTWMVIDTMIMKHKSQVEFSGDVYKFFPYLTKYKINGFDGEFLPLSYIYRTKQNIIELKGVQYHSDLSYTQYYDVTKEYEDRDSRGAEKPTIR